MKKRTFYIICFVIFCCVSIVWAAEVKWSALAECTTVADADVLCIIDSGTSKKITVLNFFDTIDTFAELNTIVADKTLVNEEDAAAWDALGTFNLGITITTGDPFTLGVVRWDNGSDLMDGEQIAADTIDNDSIDWGDMTDLTTDGAVSWGNIAEGELADSTVVTGDIKDGTIALADLAAAAYAKDLVTTAPITGAADNIFVGADSDVTVAITILKDIVTTAPLTGAEDDVLPGADADLTLALDFTAAWDFGGAAGSEWVNDGNPTTDATGEIALDTTITDHQPLYQYYDGGENMTIIAIDTAQLPAEDNEIVKYDAGADKFVLEADDSAGTTAYDDIADPDAASSITFADGETVTWATTEDSAASFFTIDDSDADLAANTYLLHLLYSVDDDQANADYFKCEDAGGVVFSIQQDGDTSTTGTLEAAAITEGGVAVYNDDEMDILSEITAILTDVTKIFTDDDFPAVGTDPDVDAAGEIGRDSDGANETGDSSLRGYDGAAQFSYSKKLKTISFTLISPDTIDAADLIPVWHNTSGMTFTIVEWKAWSDDDNVSLEIEELTDQTDYTAITTVDAVEIATDGTGVYYASDGTITHAAIEHDHSLAIDFDTSDTPDYVQISITGWYNSDVD